jgi:hypothetical protein
MRILIAIVAALLFAHDSQARSCQFRETCMTVGGETIRGVFHPWPKGAIAKPEFKAGEWPCPFWRYQQIGQPVMYYSLKDHNASVDDLCTEESKREGRE